MIRVGQRLRAERMHKGLSIEEVAAATKIRAAFLSAIEKGEYHKLPSAAYAQGFVSNYAAYLGLSRKETLALFRREFDEEKVFQVLPESMSRHHDFPLHRPQMQHTVYAVVGILLLLLGYLFFQYRSALINPRLDVFTPKEGVLTSQDIVVSGKTDPNAIVYVNNDLVSLNTNGEFQKKITVFPGETTLVIRAKNRFGKESVVERKIEVKPGA